MVPVMVPVMAATSQRDLVDRITGYRLNDILDNSPSYVAARDLLRDEYDLTVSEASLRRWHALEAAS